MGETFIEVSHSNVEKTVLGIMLIRNLGCITVSFPDRVLIIPAAFVRCISSPGVSHQVEFGFSTTFIKDRVRAKNGISMVGNQTI